MINACRLSSYINDEVKTDDEIQDVERSDTHKGTDR